LEPQELLAGLKVVVPTSQLRLGQAVLSEARPVGQVPRLPSPKVPVTPPLSPMVPLPGELAVLGRASPLAPKGPRPSVGLWPRRLGSFSAGLPFPERRAST
jgi:hypothetical protein